MFRSRSRTTLIVLVPSLLILIAAGLFLRRQPQEAAAVAALATSVPTAIVLSTPIPSPTATAVPPTRTPRPTSLPLTVLRSRYSNVPELEYLPILMYHYVRVVDEASDPLGFRLSVRPDRFAEQMAWLQENGYTTLRMRDLADCLRQLAECPARPVALTFDDGYADAATEALPILQRYGLVATFYIATGLIGQPGYLSWDQVRELHAAGMEIGSHTVNHRDLTGLSEEEAHRELLESLTTLERELGADVVSLSYPAGSYNPQIAALARELGYTNAVTTRQDADYTLMYELPRRRILGGETIAGYPWYFQEP